MVLGDSFSEKLLFENYWTTLKPNFF
jgi:hypothetical protein